MPTPTLFDPLESDARKQRGIQRADDHAEPAWKAEALSAILECAASFPDFTSDDVWALLVERKVSWPHEGRALGAMMLFASRSGWIVKTGVVRNSMRPRHHSYPCTVWRKL